MSCLILIAGLPATGKTSFARYLSAGMKLPMISKDIIKEHLFDTVGFKSRDEKVALGIAAMDIMYHVAETHLAVGLSIILENNFENASKPGLTRLIEKYRCATVTVKFSASRDVLAERFLARDKSPERHRGHVVNTRYPETEIPGESEAARIYPAAPEGSSPGGDYWHAMKERGMDSFSIGGVEIPVDTTDFSKVSYDKIREEIESLAKLA